MEKVIRISKLIGNIFLPLLPLLAGIILKMSFFDEIPDDSSKYLAFMEINYFKTIWIEFLIIAFLLPIAFLENSKVSSSVKKFLLSFPAICFILIMFFSVLLPKFQVANVILTIYIPFSISLLCLLINQFIIVKE